MRFKHILSFFFLMISLTVFSQTQKELEAQRKALQQQVSQIKKLLSETKSVKKTALEQLNDLNLQINAEAKLIKAFTAEAKLLESKITANQKEISALTEELKTLKKDYANMIYKSYKSKSQNSRIMFLLSSENFNQAYKRLQYMKQYTDFRKAQGVQISKKTSSLVVLNDTLKVRKSEKEKLVKARKKAQQQIEIKRKNQQVVVAKVKKQEKKYSTQIKKKQREERKVNAQIDKIISKAIAKSNKGKTKKSSGFAMTAEAKLLAKKFEANKGKLPWPIEKGVVTRRFGKQPHPTIPGIIVETAGVYIRTENGANARAIFNGKVMDIIKLPGNRKGVYVRHGNYISFYANLETVFVKTGDVLTTKQKIGKIYTDKISKKTILKFQLRKNLQRLNPASWIYKM